MLRFLDAQPEHIEDLFDELDALSAPEVGSFIRQLSPDECGWLARYLRRRLELDREHAAEEIELELNVCSPCPSSFTLSSVGC